MNPAPHADAASAALQADGPRALSRAVDARRNLVANFRSVSVHGAADGGPDRMGPPARALVRWLHEYHAAYVAANDAENGGRLHLLQTRTLTLSGDHLLHTTED